MKISIRRFEIEDIPYKLKWINDPNNNQFLHYDLPLRDDKTIEWFNQIKSRNDRYDAVIEVNGTPVGLIGLLSIDYSNEKAEYYIVLGETEFKGKGIARKASELLIEFAFEKLGLQRIYLYTEKENVRAQELFERMGFTKEGFLRKDIKNRGILVDRFVYGINKNDFYERSVSLEHHIRATNISKLKTTIGNNNLYIKRDDLLPISFGGNKARKALYFFQEIGQLGSDCIVTYGSSQSNHSRIIANMAKNNSLPVYIITPIENTKLNTNSDILALLGARIIKCPLANVKDTINNTLGKLKSKGYNPYFIEGGGHGDLGTKAYIDAYREILDYEVEYGVRFDYIFHASGTGTTQAGLMCGTIINNDENREIIGISIARNNPVGKQVILHSINSYLNKLGKRSINADIINFIDDYVLNGYGAYNESILGTIKNVLIQDGIPLDTTYTGKAFWGMLEYISKYKIRGKSILFIHTGGTPLFFDDLEVLISER